MERLSAYEEAEEKFREAFASLSAQALHRTTRFLQLADMRLRQAHETTADMTQRRSRISCADGEDSNAAPQIGR